MMNKSIQIRVDPGLKKQLERILGKMGLDMPTAVRMYFAKIVMMGGIPFSLTSDEDHYTPAQLKRLDRLAREAKRGKGLSGPFSSADAMIRDLHNA